jgi:hypothetical protein
LLLLLQLHIVLCLLVRVSVNLIHIVKNTFQRSTYQPSLTTIPPPLKWTKRLFLLDSGTLRVKKTTIDCACCLMNMQMSFCCVLRLIVGNHMKILYINGKTSLCSVAVGCLKYCTDCTAVCYIYFNILI